jgi:hypothetical protein
MTVDYLVMCAGRTFFTKLVVDSILARARHKPLITLVNTGWTHHVWHDWANDYIRQGKVARIVDADIVDHNPATPFRLVDFIGDAPYYFVTDNDCLAPMPEDGVAFDEHSFKIFDDNPSLLRFGMLLFRNRVTPCYVEKFPEWEELKPYIKRKIIDPEEHELKVHPNAGGGAWTPEIRKQFATPDPRLVWVPADTTFTAVRKPHKLGAGNRYSLASTMSYPTSHIGYVEEWFYHPEYAVEMMLYNARRVNGICPEFKDFYHRRERSYQKLVYQQESIQNGDS